MAVYTHLENDDIATLLDAYEVGELRFAVGITQGVENSNFLLEVDGASGVTKYILTVYEKRVDANDLPFFMGLMKHLHANGVPCPLPVTRSDGEVIGTIKGKPAALITFLEGRSRSAIRNSMVAELGRGMAELHKAGASFEMARANNLSVEGWQALYAQLAGQLNDVAPALDALIDDELAYLKQHWPDDVPQGVIHADLFPDNVFFTGEKLSGIIDFYFACTDAYVYDIAICLNCWCFETGGEFNLTKAKLLLNHYSKVRPLSDAERAALPIMARGAALRFLLTRAFDWVHHQPDAQVRPKDPMEYVKKLQFHQQVTNAEHYGI